MSRFFDFFEENAERVDVLHAYAPSSRFKEAVKDCKALSDFDYEERGIRVLKGDYVPMAVKYIGKYVKAGVIEENQKAEEYTRRIEWQLRATTPDTANKIRKKCEYREEIKKGLYQKFTDYAMYAIEMAAACIVFPDLRDADLQDSYGVRNETELLKRMIPLEGELSELEAFVSRINGLDMELDNKAEEAKN